MRPWVKVWRRTCFFWGFSSARFCCCVFVGSWFLVERRKRLEISLSRLATCQQRAHGAMSVCHVNTFSLSNNINNNNNNNKLLFHDYPYFPCKKGTTQIWWLGCWKYNYQYHQDDHGQLTNNGIKYKLQLLFANGQFFLHILQKVIISAASTMRKFCRGHFGLNTWKVSWSRGS